MPLSFLERDAKLCDIVEVHVDRYEHRDPSSVIESRDLLRYFPVDAPMIYTSKGLFGIKLLSESVQENASQESNAWWFKKVQGASVDDVLQYVNRSVSERARKNVAMFLEHIISPLITNIEVARLDEKTNQRALVPFGVRRGIYLLIEDFMRMDLEAITEGEITHYGEVINSQFTRVKEWLPCVESDEEYSEVYTRVWLKIFQYWRKMMQEGGGPSLFLLSLINVELGSQSVTQMLCDWSEMRYDRPIKKPGAQWPQECLKILQAE